MDRRRLLMAAAACGLFSIPALAAAGEKGGGKQLTPFLQLKALTLTIVRPNRRHGAMTVEVGLSIPDPGLRARAELLQPVLRDAYIRALQPWAMRMSPGTPPDIGFLTLALQRETNQVLGRPGAQVLLGGLMVM